MVRRYAALLLLLLLVPIGGRGEDPESRREQELEAIRGEIARLQAELEQVRRKAQGLQGELQATDVELELQRQRLAEATTALELVAGRVEATTERVEELVGLLDEARAALRGRLIGLYRLGRHGYLRLFLSVDPEASLLDAIRLLRFLARRDSAMLEDYLSTRTRYEFERDELVRQREEMDRWLEQEQSRRRRLTLLRRRQALLLERARREEQQLAGRAEVLQDKERRLASLIDLLEERSGERLDGTPIQEFQGVLDWPAEGKVRLGFGPRKDPRYRTAVPHNGIELALPGEVAVRTIFGGEVLYAAPLEGYGKTVIVRHPGRVFTLYAGLSRLGVNRGDVLALDDTVGQADRHLYFEIRVENQPRDPLEWLR